MKMHAETRNGLMLGIVLSWLFMLVIGLPLYIAQALPLVQQNPTQYMVQQGGRAEAEVLVQVIIVSLLVTIPFAIAATVVQIWYLKSQPKVVTMRFKHSDEDC
ncbi:MAG: hypothetical protein JWP89_2741 [Schlesneria sp.]|nr:hypothetical protein [Schlesneria sp.]